MKRIFVAIGLSLLLGTSAFAKTPKEVLEPYKAYRAAVKANDAEAALKQARLAWEAAETHLGDHKTTGDYAEVLTIKAGAMVKSRNGKAMLKVTGEALDVFSDPSDAYKSAYPIFANLYQGFAHEYEDNVLDAALSYQKVMDYVGKLDYETHPIVGRALGRWIHMRGRLQDSGDFEEAKVAGLCECWPYDIERNESVKPLKRVPPKFPRRALNSSVSGFTIVEFDLDDEGNTMNPKTIASWPPDLYEKAALQSLYKWKYFSNVFGRACGYDLTTAISALWTNVDDVVGCFHDVEIMLDDNHRVACSDEFVQHGQQLVHIFKM